MKCQASVLMPVPTDPPPRDGVLRYLGYTGCVRLPLRVDAPRLADELACLPADTWGQAARDPVVLGAVESFFAIGYPRGPKPLPPEDRPVLARLPYLRHILRDLLPGQPVRAIVARQSACGLVPIHIDTPRFFRGTVRVSIQVDAAGPQGFYCDGLRYDLAPGEVWALDNLRPHGIRNTGARARTSVIADLRPSAGLAQLLLAGAADQGQVDAAGVAELAAQSKRHYRQNRWRSWRYQIFRMLWRWR
jgi:hypothetical protein